MKVVAILNIGVGEACLVYRVAEIREGKVHLVYHEETLSDRVFAKIMPKFLRDRWVYAPWHPFASNNSKITYSLVLDSQPLYGSPTHQISLGALLERGTFKVIATPKGGDEEKKKRVTAVRIGASSTEVSFEGDEEGARANSAEYTYRLEVEQGEPSVVLNINIVDDILPSAPCPWGPSKHELGCYSYDLPIVWNNGKPSMGYLASMPMVEYVGSVSWCPLC